MEMNTLKPRLGIALLWIVVFLLGGVAGAVGHYLYAKKMQPPAASGQPRPQEIQDALAKVLDLDAGQKKALKAMFAKSLTRFRALNQEYKPKWQSLKTAFDAEVMKIRVEFDQEVKTILRPDQRAKFEEFLKKVYATPPPKNAR